MSNIISYNNILIDTSYKCQYYVTDYSGDVRDNRNGRYPRVGGVGNAGLFSPRLLVFYQKYNTENVGDVAHVLAKYKDNCLMH